MYVADAQDVITVLSDAKGNVRHLNEEASRFEVIFNNKIDILNNTLDFN